MLFLFFILSFFYPLSVYFYVDKSNRQKSELTVENFKLKCCVLVVVVFSCLNVVVVFFYLFPGETEWRPLDALFFKPFKI